MPPFPSIRAVAIGFALALVSPPSVPPLNAAADETSKPLPAAGDAAAEYTRAVEKRADDVIAALELKDPAKAKRVHEAVVPQYRALKDWHDANDAELKSLAKKASDKSDAGASQKRIDEINASLKKVHDHFIAQLSENLNDAQVEKVKDTMTYNVVHVTYNAYQKMLPTLTDAQKAKILETLKVAREDAMDGGSSEEKHAVFGRYKGRINNYLSTQGYDLKKASKEWSDREQAAKAGAK
jgi:hypothetical protein